MHVLIALEQAVLPNCPFDSQNGITFEKNYPLTDKNGNCKPLSPTDKLVKVSSYTCEE